MLIKQIKEILQVRRHLSEEETSSQDKPHNLIGFADQKSRWLNGRKRLDVCLQKIAKLDDVKQKSDEFFYSDSAKQIQYEFCMMLAKQLCKQIFHVLLNNKFQELILNHKDCDSYFQKLFQVFEYLPDSDSKYQEQEIETRKYLFEIIVKHFKSINADQLKKTTYQQRPLECYCNQVTDTILELFFETYILKQQTDDYATKVKEQKRKILQNTLKDQNSLITQKLKQQLPQADSSYVQNEDKEINVFCALSNDEQYGKVLEEALLFDSFYCNKLETNSQYHHLQTRKLRGQSHKYSKQELEYFINQYKVNQLRTSKKNIGDLNKSDYSNRYYQTRDQRIKSEQNKSRIIDVTDKVNKKKINTIQSFFNNDLEIKKQENKEVIDFLVRYDYKKVPKQLQNFIFHQQQEEAQPYKQELLHKLFFKFSNKQDDDPSQSFQFLHWEDFISLCKELQIPLLNDQLSRIYHKCIEDQSFFSQKGLTYSYFLDAVQMMSTMLNDNDSNAPEQFTRQQNQVRFRFSKKEIELNNDPEQKIQRLLEHYILPNQHIILEEFDLQLQNCEYYEEFMSIFSPLITQFFNDSTEKNQQYVNFDAIVKSFMKIKLCPSKITKATLRYYYNYNLIEDEGLTKKQFHHFINMLALFSQKKLIITKEYQSLLQYYTYIFEQKNGIKKDTLTVYKKLMLFYVKKDSLRLIQNIKFTDQTFERKESAQDY